ncbi:MAG TPA: SIS domain-containing protein [Acidobacteriaceae bacterium]|nr:SIS domain-containing protein [Acidobacteriaceae bacterium]
MNRVVSENLRGARATLDQLAGLESEMIAASDAIAGALLSGGKLLACGNGGSAADASHLTTEFVCRFNQDRRPYPAISLAAHGGDLTAIGNDYEFNDIFARQVQAFGKPGDVLIAFTSSGRSENVRRALVAAKELQVKSIAFLGKDGGTCAGLADIEFLVTGTVTARIQEGHQFLFHTICEMVEERLQA